MSTIRRSTTSMNDGEAVSSFEMTPRERVIAREMQDLIRTAVDALEFYGACANWQTRVEMRGCGCCSDILEPPAHDDAGQRARDALAKLRGQVGADAHSDQGGHRG